VRKAAFSHSKKNSYLKFFLLLSLFLISSNLNAHSRGESYSKWYISETGAELIYTLALKDIAKLTEYFQSNEPNWQERVREHIQNNTLLFDHNLPCKTTEDFIVRQSAGYLQVEGQFRCNSSERLKIINNSIFDIDSRHMHILRVNFADGTINEKVLLNRDREWQLFSDNIKPNQKIVGSTFLSYLIIGFEHIVSGWDHLAFLAAICLLLLLMQATTKTLIVIISGFTIGHSASLILTVLGYLNPNGLVVESFIAFSIALLAIETIAFQNKTYFSLSIAAIFFLLLYILGKLFIFQSAIPSLALLGLTIFVFCYFNLSSQSKSTLPQLLLTLLFGLVHGFGFAGSIQDVGLPQDRLIVALISFNIGVELGQLLIVGLALFVIAKVKLLIVTRGLVIQNKLKPIENIFVELSAASLCAVGLFWFVERSIL
jgi:hypothetical protein